MPMALSPRLYALHVDESQIVIREGPSSLTSRLRRLLGRLPSLRGIVLLELMGDLSLIPAEWLSGFQRVIQFCRCQSRFQERA
jgi:hypothetical protein